MPYPVYMEKQWLKILWIAMPVVNLISLGLQFKAGAHGEPAFKLMLPAITFLVLVFLGTLNTSIDETYLRWSFGFLGLPAWKVALADIATVEATKTRCLEGYGIKLTCHGMLYNATGNAAISVHMRSGKSFRLGTQDPQRLLSYISPRINVKSA